MVGQGSDTIGEAARSVAAPVIETTPAQRPTRKQVLNAYAKLGISKQDGIALIKWLRDKVIPACRENNGTYYVKQREMTGRIYAALDTIMPHGQMGAPGSAADLTARFLLDETAGEYGLTHDMTGALRYCNVSITDHRI